MESKDVPLGTAYLIPLEWRKSEEQPHHNGVCCRAGDETTGLDMEEKRGEVSVSHEHTCFPGQSSPWVPRESLLELGAEIKQ